MYLLSLFSTSSIISRFSWLAIHALAQAAEGCSYPLRLGVSKPLGASSVVPDYQTNSRIYHGNHYSYVMAPSSQLAARQGQSLVRQLHVRAAKATSSSAPKPRYKFVYYVQKVICRVCWQLSLMIENGGFSFHLHASSYPTHVRVRWDKVISGGVHAFRISSIGCHPLSKRLP